MKILMRLFCLPGVLLVTICLLIVYGEDAAEEFFDGVAAFFNGLE